MSNVLARVATGNSDMVAAATRLPQAPHEDLPLYADHQVALCPILTGRRPRPADVRFCREACSGRSLDAAAHGHATRSFKPLGATPRRGPQCVLSAVG